MAAAADSSSSSTTNTHSPRFRRSTRGRATPSRAARAESNAVEPRVRSPEQSATDAVVMGKTASGEIRDQQGDVKEKKSAWNKPANGVIEVGAVMGAVSWPPLSESARASPRSSSSDSLVGLSDGSVSAPSVVLEVMAAANPVVKPNVSNQNPSSSSNNTALTRQKSVKRSGGGGGGGGSGGAGNGSSNAGALANGGPVPRSPPAVGETSQMASDRLAAPGLSPRAPPSRNSGGWEHGTRPSGFSPQVHGGDHHRTYSGNNRRGNNGGGSDGGHNNYGGRRNHERGVYEWNSHRNFSGRDVQLKQQPHHQRFAPGPFLVPPVSGPAPFVRPGVFSPVSGSPMGFPDMSAQMMYIPVSPQPMDPRVVPFVAPPVIFPAPDPQLQNLLLKQIEYYFSPENLCKDIFLRQKMEEQGGWVSVSIIANFNRVKQLTNNARFILDTVRTSPVIEVQGDKIRKRNDWKNWILPSPTPANNSSSPSIAESSSPLTHDTLAARFAGMGLETGSGSQSSFRVPPTPALSHSRSSSGEFNSQSQVLGNSNGDGIGEISA